MLENLSSNFRIFVNSKRINPENKEVYFWPMGKSVILHIVGITKIPLPCVRIYGNFQISSASYKGSMVKISWVLDKL